MNTLRPILAAVLLAATSAAALAQSAGPKIEFPAPSPSCTLKQRVGLTDFEVKYSRPSVKGRKMFGGHEEFGKVWRTGANAATRITFNTPVKFAGQEVAAGTYAIFTIPDANEWTFILNSDFDQWGAFRYDQAKDALRLKVKPQTLASPVESFTIDFDELRDESASLFLAWENTKVAVKITVDVESKVLPQIETAMSSPEKKSANFYFSAAQFYHDHNKDLNKALGWVDEAVTLNPKAYYMIHLKAKILAKLGRKDEAIAAAQKSSELAAAEKDSGYVESNTALINSLK